MPLVHGIPQERKFRVKWVTITNDKRREWNEVFHGRSKARVRTAIMVRMAKLGLTVKSVRIIPLDEHTQDERTKQIS